MKAWCAALAFGLTLGTPSPAWGQDRWLVEGLADAEFWATDAKSVALTRNDGRPLAVARLRLWTAVELHPTVLVFALGEMEGEGETGDNEIKGEVELEQLAVRYMPSAAFTLEAGLIESVVGTFAQRRLSVRNPLIGQPDAYPTPYPWGVKVAGSISRFDFRVALISLPLVNTRYVPEPGHHLRPAVGGGFSPLAGLRLGASATIGSYLNADLAPLLPTGTRWNEYEQRLVSFDLRFSRGYFEAYAEVALSEYEVPTRSELVAGYSYYVEVKYTWGPRFFTAARFEENNYAFVRAVSVDTWFARATSFLNGEIGAGYRLGSHTLAKVSYRRDRWPRPPLFPGAEDGHALALQFAHRFDVVSLLRRRR